MSMIQLIFVEDDADIDGLGQESVEATVFVVFGILDHLGIGSEVAFDIGLA